MGAIIASLFMKEQRSSGFTARYPEIPLPDCMHRTVSEAEVSGRKVLVIGDVHGCLDELQSLISESGTTKDDCLYVFCGDIINKGPKNCETLRYVMGLDAVVVRGNHEERVIKEWFGIRFGTQDQYAKGYDWIRDLTNEEMGFLIQLPYTVSIPHLQALVVHGGLMPWQPLRLQRPHDMVSMRDIVDVDGPRPYPTAKLRGGLPWSQVWFGPEHVYFGHDARRGLQRRAFATGLDTGCLYGKLLTAVFIHGKENRFLSVKAKRVYRETNPSALVT